MPLPTWLVLLVGIFLAVVAVVYVVAWVLVRTVGYGVIALIVKHQERRMRRMQPDELLAYTRERNRKRGIGPPDSIRDRSDN